ncbi:hypothetical protein A33I_14220 [Alkalihalophilus marmarensis DSM 21297]|uniref:Uncharacterized protein n=1 Tax=Alkalihalophilus marmarensis DSM 21297 TaxID=1188261 RepID=U6SMP3_9BACI|nr:hypothetical protein A33I_14220 [Alkalihalophilus marmarensis DSM 21297]
MLMKIRGILRNKKEVGILHTYQCEDCEKTVEIEQYEACYGNNEPYEFSQCQECFNNNN